MIERKKLENMIKNGKTFYWELETELPGGMVYKAIPSTYFREFELLEGEVIATDKYGKYWSLHFNDIYDNEKRASWREKRWAKRMEYFEPPTWDEIDKSKHFAYTFSVPKLSCRGQIIMYSVNIAVKWGYIGQVDGCEYFGEPTKENYEKAVDFARKLFLGEVENA